MNSEAEERKLNGDLLDQAEAVRATGKFAQALRLTRQALQTDDKPLSHEEIKELSQDDLNARLLAVGARLIGESTKSLMKRAMLPGQLQDLAGDWLQEAGLLYSTQELRNAAAKMERDHHGSDYDFEREFARDIADYLATLSLIVTGNKEKALVRAADNVWSLLIDSFEAEDTDKHFFVLERSWFLFKTGRKDQIDIGEVYESFRLYISSNVMNRDRVIAMAIRTAIMAEAADQPGVVNEAVEVLKNLNATVSLSKEASKVKLERYRTLMFKMWTVFVGKSPDYLELIASAHDLGLYQQQRFTHARK